MAFDPNEVLKKLLERTRTRSQTNQTKSQKTLRGL